MKIVISVKSALTLARSIAAFRRLGKNPDDISEFDALLDTDRDDITATAIRSAFAEVVLELSARISDVHIPADSDILSAEITLDGGESGLSFTAIAKLLEQTVATRALALLLAGSESGNAMLELSRLHAAALDDGLERCAARLGSFAPFVRSGFL